MNFKVHILYLCCENGIISSTDLDMDGWMDGRIHKQMINFKVHILYVMKNYMISSTDSHMDGWMDELINE
jgi:hypothetical protein